MSGPSTSDLSVLTGGYNNRTRDADLCQNPGDHPAPYDAPWSGTARADDKTCLYRYVLHSLEGTPLAKVVTDVFGDDTGDYTNTGYQLARRLA